MFVKYSCGCIGLPLDGNSAIVISACDKGQDDDQYSIFVREGLPPSLSPLRLDECKEIFMEFGRLIYDGYRFREIQRLLKD